MGLRFAAPALLALGLAGCASDDDTYDAPPPRLASALPAEHGSNHVQSNPGQALLQCVPYAREHSAIKITGDAYTWWNKAAGKYERGANPATGTVMVLFHYSGSNSGHVAVVRRVVSAREIRIDHANWLDDGAIYINDPVVDVSTANDWSQIRVWNIKTGGWGTKIFPVQGFIGAGSSASSETPRNSAPADVPQDVPQDAPQDVPQDVPQNDVVTAANMDADAAPTPVIPKPRPLRAAPVRTATAPPRALVPVAMAPDDRNPAPSSGFALTPDDLAIP